MIHITKTKDVELLAGTEYVQVDPCMPFDREICDFLCELSSALIGDVRVATMPDVMAFAYWIRKSNVESWKAKYAEGEFRIGRGLAFHITPSNVPVNFAFSYVLGILSGNANIVRIPTASFLQVQAICDVLNQVIQSDSYTNIRNKTAIVRYGKNTEVTEYFSSLCNARIIWGGDDTIRSIRQHSIPVRAIELVFPDRYSFSIIDLHALSNLEDSEISQLAHRFYNDTYSMDQNACSSPHFIAWLGDSDPAVKERFWMAIAKVAAKKYDMRALNQIDKYTQYLQDSIDHNDKIVLSRRYSEQVYVVTLNGLMDEMESMRGKFGYFYEVEVNTLSEISPVITEKFQTITYFGVNRETLRAFISENRLRGVDRIVPIGSALNIDIHWDGFDMIGAMSRIVEIR